MLHGGDSDTNWKRALRTIFKELVKGLEDIERKG